MPPQQRQNHAQQLQDSKDENAKLKTQLENLSKLDEEVRELRSENNSLRSLLEQAKQAALANNSKARITDLEKQVEELNALLRTSHDENRAVSGDYDRKLSNYGAMESQFDSLQREVRQLREERDALMAQTRNAQQTAAEKVAAADQRMTQMNELLRAARTESAQYKSMVIEVRSVLQGNPDVLAAVRQKVGLQN